MARDDGGWGGVYGDTGGSGWSGHHAGWGLLVTPTARPSGLEAAIDPGSGAEFPIESSAVYSKLRIGDPLLEDLLASWKEDNE